MSELPVVVVGAGPAGMATALALQHVGHSVVLLERYAEATPAGSGLSLFAPVVKALRAIGVDTTDLGAPCSSIFRRPNGRVLAEIQFPQSVIDEFGGGFFGLLRPELYRRLAQALPAGTVRPNSAVVAVRDLGAEVEVELQGGEKIRTPLVVGADGIHSIVRKTLWGESPIREHKLHVICGFTFELPPRVERDACIVQLGPTVQGSFSEIVDGGRKGHQWWVLEAWDPEKPAPENLHSHAAGLAKGFGPELSDLIAATDPADVVRWQIRDRKPMKKWSRGRITLVGDAAHPTSPYAAYGAGMGIGDGYFLGQVLAGIDLSDRTALTAALARYEEYRVEHTTSQVEQAYMLGQTMHRAPAIVRPLRDVILDRSGMMQKQMGEKSPREIVAQIDEMHDELFASA